jgi:hypothetical protein
MDVPAQEENENMSFLFIFVLFGPSVDWMLTLVGERGILSGQSTESKLIS